MTRGLAIETSGRVGSAAVAEDGRAVDEESFPHGLKHAAELVPMIDRLCRRRGWTPRDVDEVYVSAGPGSFTGLRVGITVAKTLSFATNAKLVAVPTVEVLALNAPPAARQVVIVLDAKRDQIFTARLARAEGSEEWETVEAAHLGSLTDVLGRSPRPVYLIGEGIPYHQKFLPPGDTGVIVTDESAWRGRAAATATLGFRLARQGHFTEPDRLNPVYIRRPEAEEKFEATRKESPG